MPATYYPPTNDGRADWWQNILDNNSLFAQVGFSVEQTADVINDSRWGVYLYRTVRDTFEMMHSTAIAYCDMITDGANGSPMPVQPTPPAWPAEPGVTITAGIEERREKWVQAAKSNPGYNPTLGTALRLVAAATPFDPATYQAVLFGLLSPSPRTVTGKFRKAGGQIDGINLYGRKEGTAGWTLLGRFTATPFSALVPMGTATGPEAWEFQARAVKRDEELGLPSTIVQQIVRG